MWAGGFITFSPAADCQSSRCRPAAAERIIGSVNGDQAASAPHICFERSFKAGRPALVWSIVVEDDHSIVVPVGLEVAKVTPWWRRSDYIHIEQALLV